MIRSGLHLHFKALKNDKEALAVINEYIITTTNSPYIAKYDATAPKEDKIRNLKFPNLPKGKISNAFKGLRKLIGMERGITLG